MSKPEKDMFEKMIAGMVQNHETQYSDDAWSSMRKLLEKEQKIRSKSMKMKALKIFVAAALILVITFILINKMEYSVNGISASLSAPKAKAAIRATEVTVTQNNLHNQYIANKPLKSQTSSKLQSWLQIKDHSQLFAYSQTNGITGGFQKTNLPANNITAGNGSKSNPDQNSSNLLPSLDHKGEKLPQNHAVNQNTTADERPNTHKPGIGERSGNSNYNKLNYNNSNSGSESGNTISFGPWIGVNIIPSYFASRSLVDFQLSGGAFINFPISDKISIQTGINYSILGGKVLLKADTLLIANDIRGPVYRVTQTSTSNVGYLQIPVLLKYKFSNKFRLCGGLQFSGQVSQSTRPFTMEYKKDSSGQFNSLGYADSIESFNNNHDINRFSLEIPVGLQWNISQSFDLTALYYFGLTDVLNSKSNYLITFGNHNSTFQLRLGYKLFHKKYHEN